MDCILDDCFIPINRSVMAIITSRVEKKNMRRTQDSVEALDSVARVWIFLLKRLTHTGRSRSETWLETQA